jgi:hypothetical protein
VRDGTSGPVREGTGAAVRGDAGAAVREGAGAAVRGDASDGTMTFAALATGLSSIATRGVAITGGAGGATGLGGGVTTTFRAAALISAIERVRGWVSAEKS